jgi:6-carboxyhexanoate--CoA ligase
MLTKLYSIRMHASLQGKHISGAERLADVAEINDILQQLLARAMGRTPAPDEIVMHCDAVDADKLMLVSSLDMITLDCPDVRSGRRTASLVLECAGVPKTITESAMNILAAGASSSGGVMRGAVLMDVGNGQRLEQDRERGVRASRFDWSLEGSAEIDRKLTATGLDHPRTREALALATKIANTPGVVAELCWSDDSEYTAGYVASRITGYVRFPFMKETGDSLGGRVIFINTALANYAHCIDFLQSYPVLINKTGRCQTISDPEQYFHNLRKQEQ